MFLELLEEGGMSNILSDCELAAQTGLMKRE
jgi:hypothetical protein